MIAIVSMSHAIPEDHPIWSILTEDLVGSLLHEFPTSNLSPAFQRLHEIIVQHPSTASSSLAPLLPSQLVSPDSAPPEDNAGSVPVAGPVNAVGLRKTKKCKRKGESVPLQKSKEKSIGIRCRRNFA
jgi:hypothetical protein